MRSARRLTRSELAARWWSAPMPSADFAMRASKSANLLGLCTLFLIITFVKGICCETNGGANSATARLISGRYSDQGRRQSGTDRRLLCNWKCDFHYLGLKERMQYILLPLRRSLLGDNSKRDLLSTLEPPAHLRPRTSPAGLAKGELIIESTFSRGRVIIVSLMRIHMNFSGQSIQTGDSHFSAQEFKTYVME